MDTMHYRDELAEDRAPYGEQPVTSEAKPVVWSGAWTPGAADLAELRRWRRSRVGIPARFLDARVEQFVVTPRMATARKLAAAYVQNFGELRKQGTSMLLLGNMGTGKTTLACAVAGELAEQGYTARYTKLSEMVAAVRDTYRRDSPRSSFDVIAEHLEPDLLVVDEVGVQHGSNDEHVIVTRVLDGRYEALKPTLVVSNLNLDALADAIDARCVDRLKDHRGVVVKFDWQTLRK